MDPEAFAAARAERLAQADREIESFVRAALTRWGDDDWDADLIEATSVLWLEMFSAEAPYADAPRIMARFQGKLAEALARTTEPQHPPEESQVERVTKWISTYTANDATWRGTAARGGKWTRWYSMRDEAVRETHVVTDGQIRPVGGTFDVGGFDLHFPGEPIGPPEIWINCRCLIQPAARTGDAMTGTTYTIGPEDEVEDNPDIVVGEDITFAVTDPTDIAVETVDEDELVPDEPEEGEDLITEIPVHGVLAPEGVSTGDGRQFAIGALSTRELPIPLRYEVVSSHGGTTSEVVTVGRVDEAWRDDASDCWRFRGVVILTKPYAEDVIDGIVDGTVRGTSIDGDDAEVQIDEMPAGQAEGDMADMLMEMMNPGTTVFSRMRVAGLTIVAIPAFQEAYIALGEEFQEDLSDADREEQAAALVACGCMPDSEPEFRDVPTDERKRLADKGAAMPDGSYPIANCDDLRNAIQAIGRAKDPEATKRHIRKRKAALGCSEVELPDTWSVEPAFAAGTHDGPGWITHPIPTARIRRYWTKGAGAGKIGWGAPGDFNRCRMQLAKYVQNPDWLAGLCANMHKEALGFWPAQHHGARVLTAAASALAAPIARLERPESEIYPSEWFGNPNLERAVPLRIESDTRRIYGYLAEWGSCHVGVPGFCEEVPKNYSGYAYFRKGLIDTDKGEQPVGTLTYGTGHASPLQRIAAATAHYDQPDAVRAYVNIGEDSAGIWFAGVLAPWVTDQDIAALKAIGALSGDWREIRGSYELIAAPAVNTPGFPLKAALTASAGRQITLIGAGALAPEREPVLASAALPDTETIVGIIRASVGEYRHQEKVAERADPLRAKVRARRLEAARARTLRG